MAIIKDSIPLDVTKWTRMPNNCRCVSKDHHRCPPSGGVDNAYGRRHSLTEDIMRATNVMSCGKRALVCG